MASIDEKREQYWPNLSGTARYGSFGLGSNKSFGDITERNAVVSIDLHETNDSSSARTKVLTSSDASIEFFAAKPSATTRLVSICSINSIRPLGFPRELLRLFIEEYNVHEGITELASFFGWKPKNSDAGAGSLTWRQNRNGLVETQYLIVFPEAIQGPRTVDWTLRQVGVYHQYTRSGGPKSLWILFHAKKDSDIHKAIEASTKSQIDILQIHMLIIGTHVKSWRWYLESLNTEFNTIVNIAVTIDFTHPQAYQTGSELLQKLQNFEDIILPLEPRLQSTLHTVSKLKSLQTKIPMPDLCLDGDHDVFMDELESMHTELNGYIASTRLLQRRSQRTLDILTAGLNLRNQTKGLGFSSTLLHLTKDAVEDNATVRVVTIVTLIYLPASFVATLLGTNLFAFQGTEGSGFQVSKQFWIFIVVSIPLTFLTVGSWLFYTRRRARLARKRMDHFEAKQEEEKLY